MGNCSVSFVHLGFVSSPNIYLKFYFKFFTFFKYFKKASNGVVLAAEKKQKSVLYDDSTINKVGFYLLQSKTLLTD